MAIEHALSTVGYGGVFSNVSQGYGGTETPEYASAYDASGYTLVSAVKESSAPIIFQNDGLGSWIGRYYINVIAESGGVPLGVPWVIYAENVTEVTPTYISYTLHVGESGVVADKFGHLHSEIILGLTSGLSEIYDTTGLKGYPIYIWAQSISGYITHRLPVEYRVIT